VDPLLSGRLLEHLAFLPMRLLLFIFSRPAVLALALPAPVQAVARTAVLAHALPAPVQAVARTAVLALALPAPVQAVARASSGPCKQWGVGGGVHTFFWGGGGLYTPRARANPPPPPRLGRAPGSNAPGGPRRLLLFCCVSYSFLGKIHACERHPRKDFVLHRRRRCTGAAFVPSPVPSWLPSASRQRPWCS
jgi:hypothetical protein